MDAHHANLGRQKLEEIRLKRAAERLQKAASSGSDLDSYNPNSYGGTRSDGGAQAAERNSNILLSRINELENKNAELELENRKLLSKIDEKVVQNDSLMKRLNDLEQNLLPSLRRSLKDASIEKDAAVVAREDALSQLRAMKKRLKEAEEEQYRAEEDTAALRSELHALQLQGSTASLNSLSMGNTSEHTLALEQEIMHLKNELQQVSVLRQKEQQELAKEQLRISSLLAENKELEDKVAILNKTISEDASKLAARKEFSLQDKEKFEGQLHDMAVMVERLENSRQKLLMEIDSQSSEIEKLFEENSVLLASHKEAIGVAAQWENQVKDCLKQNEELRHILDKLRSEQASTLQRSDITTQPSAESVKGTVSDLPEFAAEVLLLKDQLAKEQSRADASAAQVLKLQAELRRVAQSHNNLIRNYRPVLRDIENSLMKIKQDNYAETF